MSDWDFLWELKGAEREFAIMTGMSYADVEYLRKLEEEERKQAEKMRIKARNKSWHELKKLRDNGKITTEEFKKRKEEVFAVEIERKKKRKALENKLKEYIKHSKHNRSEFTGVKCACYGCVSSILVYHLSFDGDTAICPKCNRKTIVPYFNDIEYYLEPMHYYVFSNQDTDTSDEYWI